MWLGCCKLRSILPLLVWTWLLTLWPMPACPTASAYKWVVWFYRHLRKLGCVPLPLSLLHVTLPKLFYSPLSFESSPTCYDLCTCSSKIVLGCHYIMLFTNFPAFMDTIMIHCKSQLFTSYRESASTNKNWMINFFSVLPFECGSLKRSW